MLRGHPPHSARPAYLDARVWQAQLEFSDPEFSQSAVASALVTFEPRVESLVTANPDDDDPEIQLVQALIAPSDGTEGDMT